MANDPTLHTDTPLVVGIDPDTDASGVAFINPATREIHLSTAPLLDFLLSLPRLKEEPEANPRFVLEDVWSTAHNWHLTKDDRRAVIAKKGYHLGRCAQVGMILRDALDRYEFPYIAQAPLRKCWKGNGGKITHAEFVRLCHDRGFRLDAKHLSRSNQEERDAALLALLHLTTHLDRFAQ